MSTWAFLMRQTCQAQRVVGAGQRGAVVYGPVLHFRARWQEQTRLVKDDQGNERVSEATCYTKQELAVGDLVWGPGKDSSQINESLTVLRVGRITDDAGKLSHYEVYL